MNREQLIERAARASHQWGLDFGGEWAGWDELRESTRREYREEAAAVVDALLPQVTTVDELVNFPPGTGFVDGAGNLVQWRGHSITYLVNGVRVDHPAWWEQDCDHPRMAWPLTVVWQP